MLWLALSLVAFAQEDDAAEEPTETAVEAPAEAAEPAGEPALEEPAEAPSAAPTGVALAPSPSPLKRPAPSAPTGAKWFEDGDITCAVDMKVDANGKPSELAAATPEADCPKRFMKATMRAVKWWRFLPAQKDGGPVESTFQAKVTYTEDGEVIGADSK